MKLHLHLKKVSEAMRLPFQLTALWPIVAFMMFVPLSGYPEEPSRTTGNARLVEKTIQLTTRVQSKLSECANLAYQYALYYDRINRVGGIIAPDKYQELTREQINCGFVVTTDILIPGNLDILKSEKCLTNAFKTEWSRYTDSVSSTLKSDGFVASVMRTASETKRIGNEYLAVLASRAEALVSATIPICQ